MDAQDRSPWIGRVASLAAVSLDLGRQWVTHLWQEAPSPRPSTPTLNPPQHSVKRRG